MPYEYDSDQVKINNPLRFEGSAYVVRRPAFFALGLYLLLQVHDLTTSGQRVFASGEFIGEVVQAGSEACCTE